MTNPFEKGLSLPVLNILHKMSHEDGKKCIIYSMKYLLKEQSFCELELKYELFEAQICIQWIACVYISYTLSILG